MIVLDGVPKFTSAFSMHFSQEVRMKLRFSTAFHCQTDGKTERVNGFLKQYFGGVKPKRLGNLCGSSGV